MKTASAFSLQPSGWKSRISGRRAGTLVLVALILGACGQKGPLYLPEKAGEVVTRPAPTAEPAPEETPPGEKPKDDESADPPR
jgi:predicted small lipoprotein YifL